jgi:hypothetical protein
VGAAADPSDRSTGSTGGACTSSDVSARADENAAGGSTAPAITANVTSGEASISASVVIPRA